MYVEDKRIETLANANIISNRISLIFEENEIRAESSLYPDIINKQFRTLIQNTVRNYSDEINSRILIVDSERKVISDSSNILINEILNHDVIIKALTEETVFNTYNFKGIGNLMYVAVPIKKNNSIVGVSLISTSLNEIYLAIKEIRNNLIAISFISILFMTVISFILADFFTKPIKAFNNAIIKMAQGKINQQVHVKTYDEFEHLATVFNTMSTKLDQVDMERKNFVANVSHELRTPVSSMKLLSESLLYQNETNIDIYREFLQDINSEADRLNNIITDLLALVNLDKETLTLNYKVTYINFLLERLIYRLKPLSDNKGIKLNFIQYDRYQINLDSEKIQQSLINIIHNAIEYTPNEGNIDISLYSEGKYIVIKIKDNGIGIKKESLSYIFDRFYRVDKARARGTGGTGLGLSIANQIVLLHQGKIDVESEVGKGTSFYVKLPRDINVL